VGATIGKGVAELRGDADVIGSSEKWRVKCQREFVLKAKLAALEARGEGASSKGKRRLEGGVMEGSLEDEARRK
jgi:protein FRG1